MNKGKENYDSYCLRGEATDVGRKRKANEDNCRSGVTVNGLVSIVCDGMGGHVGGATASKIAVDTIYSVLEDHFYEDPRQAISESIGAANNAILEYAASHPELEGMGSTCVMMIVRDGKVYLGHVGDSRIYLVRNFKIHQLTKDHSYVQMLVDSGRLSPEEAEHHPRKNEITNALGIPNMQPATVRDEPIVPEAGDCFVLCSDGLSGMVSDEEIARTAGEHGRHIQQRADALVAKANENGGLDNITVELVEFASSPAEEPFRPAVQKRTGLYIAIAAVIVVAVAASVYFFGFRTEQPVQPTRGGDVPEEQAAINTPASPTEADTDNPANKVSEQNLHTVIYTPGEPFMTITDPDGGVMVTYRTSEGVNRVIIDGKLDFNLNNFMMASPSLSCALEVAGSKQIAKITYNGRKVPRNGEEFSLVLRLADRNYTLKFILQAEARPARTTPSVPTPSVTMPRVEGKGDNSDRAGTQSGSSQKEPEKVPEQTPVPPPATPDTTNIQHV